MFVNFQLKLKEQLENTSSISYQEVREILEAFQIASGQGFAIGKTKALLEFLKEGKFITIENFNFSNTNKEIFSAKELANIFRDIDQHIDITADKEFKQYF